MAKNLPANAGEMSLITGLGRSHVLRSDRPMCQLLDLGAATTEAQALAPVPCNKSRHRNEEPADHAKRRSTLAATAESPGASAKACEQPKMNKYSFSSLNDENHRLFSHLVVGELDQNPFK